MAGHVMSPDGKLFWSEDDEKWLPLPLMPHTAAVAQNDVSGNKIIEKGKNGEDSIMSDNNEYEVSPKVEDENTTIYEKAIIIGLEEVIEELGRVNENIDFNNSNITNLRQEINGFRDEFGMIQYSTSKSSRHLETISQILVITFVAEIIVAFWLLSFF
jgi:hypothetical protein